MAREALDVAFHPRSVAVVGASATTTSAGYNFVSNLITYGFQGKIYPVTAKWPAVLGHTAYATLKDVPGSIDYVICCLPAAGVMDLLRQCAEKEVRVVHLFTGRFSETGQKEPAFLEKEILRLANELDIRLIGPNCMGIYNPEQGISFNYDFPADPGKLGMFNQSGGASAEFVYYGGLRGLRFSKVISYGNAIDINETELLQYLANDDATRVIASYIEGLKDGEGFIHALKQATPLKPVIVLKAGRSGAGARAAASHTAAMAGTLSIWEAALRQAGAVQARSLEDMIDLALAFYFLPPVTGNRVGVVGGGGGTSVLSADEWEEAGFELAPFPQEIERLIRRSLPELWWGWIKNPVDMSLFPLSARTENLSGNILKEMTQADGFDVVVANLAMGGPFSRKDFAAFSNWQVDTIIEVKKTSTKAMVAVLNTGVLRPSDFGDERWQALADMAMRLTGAGIPVYPNPHRAAGAVFRLMKYHQWKEMCG
ncbi:CoA-binding protein [Thermodesulfobacteriota bacterium]